MHLTKYTEGWKWRYFLEQISSAPSIVEAICQRRPPGELNAETLLNRIGLPLEWRARLKAIGIS